MSWTKQQNGTSTISDNLSEVNGELYYKGTKVDKTTSGSNGATPTLPSASKLDFYFDAVSTQGFALPAIIFDCSNVSGFSSGGSFTVEFTPSFSGSPAQIKRVDDWWGWNASGGLAWDSVNTNVNADGNITSGTRYTITRILTPPAGKTHLMIIPKFVIADGDTDTNYQVSVSDLVVKLNGVEIPRNTLVSSGMVSAYTSSTNAVKAVRTTDYSPVYLPSRWEGKRVCTEGDSITATSGGQAVNTRYPIYLKDILKPNNLYDRSASGKAISNFGTSNALVNQVGQNFDFDLLTIALGVNDYSFHTPMGTIGSKTDAITSYDKATFYGAYRYCLDRILESNPFITIVMLLPITKSVETANNAGKTLQDYRDAITELGKMYNIPVYQTNFIINQKNSSTFSYDGLHINDNGHKKYADYLGSFLARV